MRFTALVAAIAASFILTSTAIADATTIKALPQEDVLAYVEELLKWQKDAASIETTTSTTREILLQDSLQQSALKILRSGFKFAKLQATFTPATPETNDTPPMDTPAAADAPAPEQTPGQRMRQRAEENDNLIVGLQSQIGKARGAQRSELEGRLKLALAKQNLFKSVLANMRASSSNGFVGQLEKLEQSVPELNEETAKQASAAKVNAAVITNAEAATSAAPRPVSSVFTLMGDMFTTLRQQRELRNFADETDHLYETSRAFIKPLRASLDDISTHGDKASIDDQVAAFNRIGSVLVPLGDATFAINASKASLDDWQRLLDQRLQDTFRRFLVKLTILGITIAIPLFIGEAVRRAITKYVRDPKRQRQANTTRRIFVACAIVFILLFNFISDFSSFATFAGFMTAGLAVALQSVLLSLVAHLFFYGRYGVRAGDRINVAGVTGDLLQIGMVRFYMRELKKGEDGQLAYTGKTVAFPNSILFQPSAFYKYMPDGSF